MSAILCAFGAVGVAFAETANQAPALVSSSAATLSTSASATGGSLTKGVYTFAPAVRTGARLDIAGASTKDTAKAQVRANSYQASQRFRIAGLGKGYYRIVNVNSGKALEVLGTAKPGAIVQQRTWKNTVAQKWKISKVTGGYVIKSAVGNNLVLGVKGSSAPNGTSVCVYTATGAKAQVWKLNRIAQVVPDGVYALSNVGTSKRLAVQDGNIDEGTNIEQRTKLGSMEQYFQVRFNTSTGFYTVLAVNSGLALDVLNGSKEAKANIQLAASNGTNAQKWAFLKNADGSYTVRNAGSGMSLSVQGASKADGANVRQAAGNSAAQRWKLTRVKNWVLGGLYTFVTSNNTGLAVGVDDASSKTGANVQTTTYDTEDWGQAWVVASDAAHPGYYTIRNLNSRLMLGIQSTAAGANVIQAGPTGRGGQLWQPILTSGGIAWKSMANKKLVLDLQGGFAQSGTNVQAFTSNGTIAQRFRLKKADLGDLLCTTAVVVRNLGNSKVLDVAHSSRNEGALVQLFGMNDTNAQKFNVKRSGKGYAFVNANSSKAVGFLSDKTVVQQRSENGTSSQRWVVGLHVQTGTFTLKSAYTKKYLSGAGGNLGQAAKASTHNQRWILQPTTTDYFRVFINSGHGWNSNGNGAFDPGAMGSGYREADFCSDLTDRVIRYARDLYGLDVVDGRAYNLAYWRRLPKAIELGCSSIFSIHFDGGGGSGPMTMVGVNGRHPASMTLNNIMGRHLYSALPGLPHRGTQYRNDITCVNGNIPAVLVEVCFMDNARDVSYYQARKDTVARELAAGLYEASLQQSLRKSA